MGDLCYKIRPSLEVARELFGNKDVIGVEVGVDEGEHANRILLEWNNVKKLYLVDVINNIHDRFQAEGDRVQFIHKPSLEAAKLFEDNSLDFAYIDGDHSYNGALSDLYAWYPKLKIGGMLCGHDCNLEDKENEVSQAVMYFFKEKNLPISARGKDFWGIKNE